jgi:parvulin-like peptidyl-prolyl isomerase
MASQTPTTPASKPAASPTKKSGSNLPLWGIKNPFIYAGTVLFLVVVIVAFVFFPTSVGAGGSGSISFGSFAGKPISYTQSSYMVREVQALSEANPASDSSDLGNQLRNYQIYRNAFELSVAHEAILNEVQAAGIVVPEEIIDQKMAALPQFQENGAFSAHLYRQASSSQRLELRRQLKDDLLVQSFSSYVYGVRPSSKETEFIKAMAKDTRTIEYAAFPLSAYPETELAAWARTKVGDFERLKLSRITIAKEADATALRKQLEGGLAFAEAAKGKSTDSWASQGGDMGLRFKHELQADLATKADADKVATLAKGALSPVLKTSSGSFAIYRLDEAPVAADMADPAVIADARTYIMASERGKVEDWALAKAKDFAALPAKDFEANAKKEGLTVKSAGPFSIDYGDLQVNAYGQATPILTPMDTSAAPELSGGSRNEKLLTAAFALAPGSVSEPLVLGDNVLVLRVKEAGSKADSSLIDLFYPYFFQTKIDEEVRASFLASPKLQDRFMDVYLKYFTPKTGQ